MLNFNKSRSYDVVAIAGSSNINARADDSMDWGRRLCTTILFVRCVIVVDVDGDDGIIVVVVATAAAIVPVVAVVVAVAIVVAIVVVADALGFLDMRSHC